MAFDHGFIRTHETDPAGKKVGNIVQTDPDADEVYLQKVVVQDPEDESDTGVLRVTDGRAQVDQRGQVSEATGALDADETTVELAMGGYAAATFTIVGDLVGTVIFEGKISDAADWGAVVVYSQWFGDYVSSVSGGAEQFDQGAFIDVAGYDAIRLRCSAYTSGSSDVLLRTAVVPPIQRVTAFEDLLTRNNVQSQVDGHSETIGSTGDAAYVSGNGSLVSVLKGIFGHLPLISGRLDVNLGAQSYSPTVTLGASTNNIGDVDVLTLPSLPAGTNAIGTLAANSGVDIGDVDVTSVPADPFGANADAAVVAGATGSISAKLRSISRDLVANIVLAAGANIIGKVGIDQTTPGTTNQVSASGPGAAASPTVGNPVRIGGRASNAVPTDVGADGDTTDLWTNRHGAPIGAQAPHVGLNGDPWSLVHEGAQYTTAQTSTVFITGAANEKLVVTKVQIQVFGTTAGTVQLYFGTGAFSRGTSRAVFDGEFAPSATLKPGVVMDGPFISGTNGDDLLVTTSANISITVNVWYYALT